MASLKIVTWNINGIRACKIPLKQQLDCLDADILCLQETKVTRDQLDEATAIVDGYSSYFSFSKVRSGYSGVATFVRDIATPLRAEGGLSGACVEPASQSVASFAHEEEFTKDELTKLDSEGRCVITEHCIVDRAGNKKCLVVINVYCPRAAPDNAERISFKLQFYRLLQLRAEAILSRGSHVIILGDINTSHKKIDHCNPDDDAEFYANPGRRWMDKFVASNESDRSEQGGCHHFFDTYRWLHPTEPSAFTNWCSSTGARQTNYGCRLDYIMADFGLLPDLGACSIMADVEGSDHCPVKAEFNFSAVAAKCYPALCTKYFPEFAGRQQKLMQFFTRKPASASSHDKGTSCEPLAVTSIDNSLKSCVQDSDDRLIDCSYVDQSRLNSGGIFGNKSYASSTSTSAPELKRRAADPVAQKFKKSKNCDSSSGGKQSNLLNFFGRGKLQIELCQPSVSVARNEANDATRSSANERVSDTCDANQWYTGAQRPVDHTTCEGNAKLVDDSVMAWKSLLKGPPQTPFCTGHQEPCVLRTVKKDGPNKGKQFWTCSRPEGHKSNPDARCEFFVWVSRKS